MTVALDLEIGDPVLTSFLDSNDELRLSAGGIYDHRVAEDLEVEETT